MKVHIYSKEYIVLTAETIEDGVKLGMLHESLKNTGRNIPILGGCVMGIPLAIAPKIKKLKP